MEPARLLLGGALPHLATVLLAPTAGTNWFGGERAFEPQPSGLDVALPLGPAQPAVVPHM